MKKITEAAAYGNHHLGLFITGFLQTKKRGRGRLLWNAICFILFVVSLAIMVPWITDEPILMFGMVVFAILIIVLAIKSVREDYMVIKDFPKGLLVYEHGLVWLSEDPYTKTPVEKCRIDFDDVGIMKCSKREDRNKNGYISTYYTLTIYDKNHVVLWSHKGIYRNEYDKPGQGGLEYEFIDTVLTRWAEIEYERVMSSTGSFSFKMENNDTAIIMPGSIQNEDLTLTTDEMDYIFKKGYLKINRRAKPQGLFCRDDFSFSFIDMDDGYLLLYVVGKSLGIKQA